MSLAQNPFYSVDEHNHTLRVAIRNIWSTYGDVVSVEDKEKTLFKFGRNNYVGNSELATVSEFYDTGQANEDLLTENKICALVSDDTGDAGTVFKIEGHTLDTGTGFEFKVQSVTCNGQTPVALDTHLARATRIFTPPLTWPNEARHVSGKVAVYDTGSTTVTSGVVQDASAVKLLIEGDTGELDYQSQKCQTAISATDYWIITQVGISVTRDNSQTTRISAELEYKELGGVWRPLGINVDLATNAETSRTVELDPAIIVPKNSDARVRAISSRTDTQVTAFINGYLAKVIVDGE